MLQFASLPDSLKNEDSLKIDESLKVKESLKNEASEYNTAVQLHCPCAKNCIAAALCSLQPLSRLSQSKTYVSTTHTYELRCLLYAYAWNALCLVHVYTS